MYLLGILLSPRYIYILRFALASMTPKLIIHEQGRNGGRNDTRQRGGGEGAIAGAQAALHLRGVSRSCPK